VHFKLDATRRCPHDTQWRPKAKRPTLDHHDRQVFEPAYACNEAVTQALPQAERITIAPTPAEAALVLVRATRCMLRRPTPEMKSATPPSNAGVKRRAGFSRVRLDELLAVCLLLAKYNSIPLIWAANKNLRVRWHTARLHAIENLRGHPICDP
jgi:hypothetical protein